MREYQANNPHGQMRRGADFCAGVYIRIVTSIVWGDFLKRQNGGKSWCRMRDSNSRPSVYKTAALPLC